MELELTGVPKNVVAELGLEEGDRFLLEIAGAFEARYRVQTARPARTDAGHRLKPGDGGLSYAHIEVGETPVWAWMVPLAPNGVLLVTETV